MTRVGVGVSADARALAPGRAQRDGEAACSCASPGRSRPLHADRQLREHRARAALVVGLEHDGGSRAVGGPSPPPDSPCLRRHARDLRRRSRGMGVGCAFPWYVAPSGTRRSTGRTAVGRRRGRVDRELFRRWPCHSCFGARLRPARIVHVGSPTRTRTGQLRGGAGAAACPLGDSARRRRRAAAPLACLAPWSRGASSPLLVEDLHEGASRFSSSAPSGSRASCAPR